MMNNQRGLITVDFLFSMVLIVGMTGLMFALMFTLSIASVTQYVTFTAARAYYAANLNRGLQMELGQKKYLQMLNSVSLKPLYTNGWFAVDAQATMDDHTKVVPEFADAAGNRNQFYGASTVFKSKILAFKIPFFGSSWPEDDGSGSAFQALIGSYLGREPSTAECLEFTGARWRAIRNLSVRNGASYSTNTSESGYYPMTDDGC